MIQHDDIKTYHTTHVYGWKGFRVDLTNGNVLPLMRASGKPYDIVGENYYRTFQDDPTRSRVFSLYTVLPPQEQWYAEAVASYQIRLAHYKHSLNLYLSTGKSYETVDHPGDEPQWEDWAPAISNGVGFYSWYEPNQAYVYMSDHRTGMLACGCWKSDMPDDCPRVKENARHRYILAKVRVWGTVLDCENLMISENLEFCEIYSDGDNATRRMLAHKMGWPGTIQSTRKVVQWPTQGRSSALEKSLSPITHHDHLERLLHRSQSTSLFSTPSRYQPKVADRTGLVLSKYKKAIKLGRKTRIRRQRLSQQLS